jgi:prepilin-type N-terminal cleavage/methylation domain-containing protein
MIEVRNSGVRSRRSGETGFTLIETIITLVVLSLAAVGVLAVFTTGMKGSANPLLISQATQLAQGEMDQVIGEKAANGFSAGTLVTGGPPCRSAMILDFTCSRTVYFVDPAVDLNTPSAASDYKHVTVTITQPVIGNVSVDSLITNY